MDATREAAEAGDLQTIVAKELRDLGESGGLGAPGESKERVARYCPRLVAHTESVYGSADGASFVIRALVEILRPTDLAVDAHGQAAESVQAALRGGKRARLALAVTLCHPGIRPADLGLDKDGSRDLWTVGVGERRTAFADLRGVHEKTVRNEEKAESDEWLTPELIDYLVERAPSRSIEQQEAGPPEGDTQEAAPAPRRPRHWRSTLSLAALAGIIALAATLLTDTDRTSPATDQIRSALPGIDISPPTRVRVDFTAGGTPQVLTFQGEVLVRATESVYALGSSGPRLIGMIAGSDQPPAGPHVSVRQGILTGDPSELRLTDLDSSLRLDPKSLETLGSTGGLAWNNELPASETKRTIGAIAFEGSQYVIYDDANREYLIYDHDPASSVTVLPGATLAPISTIVFSQGSLLAVSRYGRVMEIRSGELTTGDFESTYLAASLTGREGGPSMASASHADRIVVAGVVRDQLAVWEVRGGVQPRLVALFNISLPTRALAASRVISVAASKNVVGALLSLASENGDINDFESVLLVIDWAGNILRVGSIETPGPITAIELAQNGSLSVGGPIDEVAGDPQTFIGVVEPN